jgi:hypothetical protein
LRRVWSDPFQRLRVAYNSATLIQPSTFIRKAAYLKAGGFNIDNRSNWDSELLVDLFMSGARIGICDAFMSSYRLHEISITNSGKLDQLIGLWRAKAFERLMGRPYRPSDRYISMIFRAIKHLSNPQAFIERLRYGPIYRRGAK